MVTFFSTDTFTSMASAVHSTGIAWASEVLATVGFEVFMFCCVFLVYGAYSGAMKTSPPGRHRGKQGGKQRAIPVEKGSAVPVKNTVTLGLLKTLRQGKLSEASTVLKQLLPEELDAVLAVAASRLLTAAARASPSEAEACLRVVAAKIKPRMLEAALSEALNRKDVNACLELGRLSDQLQIPTSSRCLQFLGKAQQLEKSEGEPAKADKANTFAIREKIRNSGRTGDLCGASGAALEGGRAHSGGGPALTAPTYGSMIKAFGQAGEVVRIWALWQEMSVRGVQPTAITLGCMVEALVANRRSEEAYELVYEAWGDTERAHLVTKVTCATLLKGFAKSPEQVLEIYKEMRSRGVECDIITYNTILNVFAQSRSMHHVPRILEDMRAATPPVAPDSVTFSTLVKGFCASGGVDSALTLLSEMQREGKQRADEPKYGRPLDGSPKLQVLEEQVLGVYKEMRSRGVECNTIAYNTILNVFAQSRSMHHVPRILDDMKAAVPPVEPDVITYSTLIKGFCASGGLDKALGLLSQMQREGKHRADEMMYNSLLDGCLREQRLQDALRLVDEMRQAGVKPSNYTLSMLVRVLGRCRRIDRAFTMVESISSEFGLKPNLQVHTCLIQQCFWNGQTERAESTFTGLLEGGLIADEKLFTVVVRGHLQAGQLDKAATWSKRAYEGKWAPGIEAQCLSDLVNKLGAGTAEAKSLLESASASRQSRGR